MSLEWSQITETKRNLCLWVLNLVLKTKANMKNKRVGTKVGVDHSVVTVATVENII